MNERNLQGKCPPKENLSPNLPCSPSPWSHLYALPTPSFLPALPSMSPHPNARPWWPLDSSASAHFPSAPQAHSLAIPLDMPPTVASLPCPHEALSVSKTLL